MEREFQKRLLYCYSCMKCLHERTVMNGQIKFLRGGCFEDSHPALSCFVSVKQQDFKCQLVRNHERMAD